MPEDASDAERDFAIEVLRKVLLRIDARRGVDVDEVSSLPTGLRGELAQQFLAAVRRARRYSLGGRPSRRFADESVRDPRTIDGGALGAVFFIDR